MPASWVRDCAVLSEIYTNEKRKECELSSWNTKLSYTVPDLVFLWELIYLDNITIDWEKMYLIEILNNIEKFEYNFTQHSHCKMWPKWPKSRNNDSFSI